MNVAVLSIKTISTLAAVMGAPYTNVVGLLRNALRIRSLGLRLLKISSDFECSRPEKKINRSHNLNLPDN